jgi:hypothetical protein
MKGAVSVLCRGVCGRAGGGPDPELVLQKRDGRRHLLDRFEIVLEEPRRGQDQKIAPPQHPPFRPAHGGADRVGTREEPVDVEAFVDQPRRRPGHKAAREDGEQQHVEIPRDPDRAAVEDLPPPPEPPRAPHKPQ